MRKILLSALLALLIPISAHADAMWASPTAPVAGVPVCSLNVQGGQLTSCGTGSAPTPTGTGTPSIASGSNDTFGEVTAGATATSVVITSAAATYTNAPFCLVTPQTGGIVSFAYAVTISSSHWVITITQTATSGDKIDYLCFQH